jgi:quercetin dioxygenase-like cupin family protein
MSFPESAAHWRVRQDTETLGTSPHGTTRLVAPGGVTGGEFGLFEAVIPPGGPGAMPHYHTGFSESFYVVSGTLALMTGHDWRLAGSGDFVHVPARGVHAFRAGADEPARFLILFVPGAPREHYFRGLAEFGRREVPPTLEEVDAFALECDQVNLRDWASDPL